MFLLTESKIEGKMVPKDNTREWDLEWRRK